MALNIINNSGLAEKGKNHENEVALATIKDVNHIVSNGEDGSVLLKLILLNEYASELEFRARENNQGVVYNALLSNPQIIMAVLSERQPATIICTKIQRPMFKMLTAEKEHIRLATFDDKVIEEWMERQEKG